MSYRLDLNEPVADALRAVAVERLERGAERLRTDHESDPAEAVHGARKDLKKTRASGFFMASSASTAAPVPAPAWGSPSPGRSPTSITAA